MTENNKNICYMHNISKTYGSNTEKLKFGRITDVSMPSEMFSKTVINISLSFCVLLDNLIEYFIDSLKHLK